MYHVFFIHSSLDGHLGYFRILAIVTSAAVNQGTREFRWLLKILFPLSWDSYREVGLLDHMVVLFFVFRGPSLLFCLGAAPVSISTGSAHMFPLLRVSASTCYSLSLMTTVWADVRWWLMWVWVPWRLVLLSTSSCIPVGRLGVFLGRMSIQFAHFLTRLLFFTTELCEFFR